MIFLKTSLEIRIFEKMKIYAMFIDEKTLCGSITRSYLRKLGYQCELSFCGLPHHVRELTVPGLRVGQT